MNNNTKATLTFCDLLAVAFIVGFANNSLFLLFKFFLTVFIFIIIMLIIAWRVSK